MANEIEGTRELSRKLEKLGKKLALSILRKSLSKATTPVIQQMKSRVPVGNVIHKTYLGREVSPGFAKRSITRRAGRTRKGVSVVLGVKSEAFYAINFIDLGPHNISRRGHRSIKPYTLLRRPWFERVFIANRTRMERLLVHEMRDRIKEATNG